MKEILEQFSWWSALDIIIIACFIYYSFVLIKGTRTAQMLMGFMILLLTFLLSAYLPLNTLNWLLSKIYSSMVVILIILFQDDIRNALRRIGRTTRISKLSATQSNHQLFDDLSRAAFALADRKIGALMVIECKILLSRYVEMGTVLDAKVSKELLMAIFHTKSPIHDGACIIRQGLIHSCGAFLPLTREENLGQELGTRHRAALGISEETDAVVILVSEEKGTVSLIVEGKMTLMSESKILKKHLQAKVVDRFKILKDKSKTTTKMKKVP